LWLKYNSGDNTIRVKIPKKICAVKKTDGLDFVVSEDKREKPEPPALTKSVEAKIIDTVSKSGKPKKSDISHKSGSRNKVGAKTGLLHIAFIMDGNGRWAKSRRLPRAAGHREGLKTIEMAVKVAVAHGIPYLSFFAFSTENWKRPKAEVDSLMRLLKTRLPEMAKKLAKQGLKLRFCGDFSIFDEELKDILLSAQTWTESGVQSVERGVKAGGRWGMRESGVRTEELGVRAETKGVVNICLNYGGRQEIVNAVNMAVAAGKHVSESEFEGFLYTKGLPDPDLLIRTGGEKRISNFFLYQLCYTELYFSDKLWPEFSETDFEFAIDDFYKRNRRFGKL